MPSVLGEILTWTADLEYWEQAAFTKLLKGKPLNEDDYQELLKYLLEDAGLIDTSGQRPILVYPKQSEEIGQIPIRLISLYDLQNINALVEKQTLSFSPNLTAVFGRNGSGKSGYARILGCAGFTRGDRDVLPDVTRSQSEGLVLSAVIEVANGIATRKINYKVGTPCPDLSSVYVFDSTSVHVHLNESNNFSFSPSGLAYLTNLAHVTDQVRDRLNSMIYERKQTIDFTNLFLGESFISECMKFLGPETKLDILDQIANLSTSDIERIEQLDHEIASLKSMEVDNEIVSIDQKISDLESLSHHIKESSDRLHDSIVDEIRKARDICRQLEISARSLSAERFKSEGFRSIGSTEWEIFIASAKKLAESEQEEGQNYPTPNSKCLLCHQPLTSEARELIKSLWKYIEGEIKLRHEEAKQELDRKVQRLRLLDLSYFDPMTTSRRTLSIVDNRLEEKVAAFIDACKKRRQELVALADSQDVQANVFTKLTVCGSQDIENNIMRLRKSRQELVEMEIDEKVKYLDKELLNLRHRQVLAQNLEKVKEYVRGQQWAEKAGRISGSTRHITKKYKELFEKLVTERYLELFSTLLIELERPLKVKVKTIGRKGETCKQIVVETVPESSVSVSATPDKVLSEGEKRAVALADFLTEVSLDTSSSAVVLDDPVTSLDLEWRDTISKILAREAKKRQVIVFTHDLPFLYFLKRDADSEKIEFVTHWVKRGEYDDKPGYVFPNNSPALEKEYQSTSRARDFYKLAKDAPPEKQESLLREGFGALRSTYEAFIIFDLFGGVVNRFEERISFLRLENVVWDRSIISQIIEKCGYLSRFIEAHLHSDTFSQNPSCSDLLKEIEDFEQLKKQHKVLVQSVS